ncbi:hypothetical protein LJR231_001809 [Phyllobacterium sp. LjRoot231]|uniref:hypothetical protein n=1 Tax=Phyllobacterium sp. LjRoot231 TaxID=3342289 RepID=UPI003ED0AFC4
MSNCPIRAYLSKKLHRYPQLTTAIVGATGGLIAFRVAAIASNFVGLNLKGSVLSIALGFTRLGGAARWTALMMGAPFVGAARGVVGMMQTIALRNRLATASLGATPGILTRVGDAFLVAGRSAIRLLSPLRFLRAAAVVLRGALMFSGVGAVLTAIAGAGTFIYNNWEGVKALIQGVGEGFMKGLAPVKPILEPIGNLAKSIYDSIAGLVGPLDVSTEKWRSWGEVIGGSVAQGVQAVVTGIQSIVGLFVTAYEKAVAFGNAIKNITGFGPGPANGGAPAPVPEVNVGGALAGGGPTRKGTSYLVGEEGPELWTAGANGRVTPHSETLSLMRKSASAMSGRSSGGGSKPAGGLNLTIPVTINGVQDIRGAAEEIGRLIEEKARFAMRGVYADVGVG